MPASQMEVKLVRLGAPIDEAMWPCRWPAFHCTFTLYYLALPHSATPPFPAAFLRVKVSKLGLCLWSSVGLWVCTDYGNCNCRCKQCDIKSKKS